jgi:hypothetical protein
MVDSVLEEVEFLGWVWWLISIISSMWEAKVGGLWSKLAWAEIITPYLKNN